MNWKFLLNGGATMDNRLMEDHKPSWVGGGGGGRSASKKGPSKKAQQAKKASDDAFKKGDVPF